MLARKSRTSAHKSRLALVTGAEGVAPGLRCLIYARVSSDMQRELHTIKAQLHQLPRYRDSQGWFNVAVISDDGISGTRLDRPGLQRVLELVRSGAVDVLLVADTSRITRSERDAESGLIYDTLRDNGVLIAMKGAIYDLRNPEQNLALATQRMLDTYMRQKILFTTAAGRYDALEEAAASGNRRAGGLTPYGYRWVATHGRHGRYEIVDKEAKIVRAAYEAAVGQGIAFVTERLNEAGYRTRKGGLWTARVVRTLLRNSAVKGEFVCRAGEDEFTLPLPPIVTAAQWNNVQRALDARRCDPAPGAQKQPQLLSGSLRCSCGASMNVCKNQWGHYYRCSTAAGWRKAGKKRTCRLPYHRADKLDSAVWAAIRKLVLAPELVKAARKNASKSKCSTAPSATSMEARLKRLDQHETQVLKQARDGLLSTGGLERELRAIAGERAKIAIDLAQLKAATPIKRVTREQLAKRLDAKGLADRRAVILEVLGHTGRITVHPDGTLEVPSMI